MTAYLARLVERAAPPPPAATAPAALDDPFEAVAPLELTQPAPVAPPPVRADAPAPVQPVRPVPAELIAPSISITASTPEAQLQPKPERYSPQPVAPRLQAPADALPPSTPASRVTTSAEPPAPDVPLAPPPGPQQQADVFMAQVLPPRHVRFEASPPPPPQDAPSVLRREEPAQPETPPQILAPPAPPSLQILQPAEAPAAPPPPMPAPSPELVIGQITVEVQPAAPPRETRVIHHVVSAPSESRTMAPRPTRARFGLGQM